jgi:UDP-N-acetylmuramoyl-tripeptide--D-alanyl-D-alanine ligase
VVTNNGKDHLEGFGNIENVIKANAELFDWLRKNQGTAFVNTNYPDLVKAAEGVKQLTYGSEASNDFVFKSVPGIYAGIENKKNGSILTSQLFGEFNCDNIATAAHIALHFKVPESNIREAVKNYSPGMNRSQILVKNDITFYVDCYNANPSSMQLALESFANSAISPKGVILGDMLELGEYSEKEHAIIIDQLKSLQLDKVILIGKCFGRLKDQIDCIHFNSTEEAKAWFDKQNFNGWSLLLKGSRGYTLEKLINF